jgi:tripartite-type tricarboxylate transporter receptor subunit TctC
VPAITGLLQGDIDFIAVTTGPISARIRSGEFRALAVTSRTRWRDFPDLPTVEEQGIPGFEVISWTGLAGPAKLPAPIVDRLNAELRRAIAVPDVKSRLESMGGDPRATTPAEMRALVANQFATWTRLATPAENAGPASGAVGEARMPATTLQRQIGRHFEEPVYGVVVRIVPAG